MKLKDFNIELINCDKCRSLNTFKTGLPILFDQNKDNVKIIFVAQNPSNNEKKEKIDLRKKFKESEEFQSYIDLNSEVFFKSKMFKFLDNMLGDNLRFVYFTNICKCGKSNNEKLSDSEINNCSCFLKEELKLFKSCKVVALGQQSYNTLVNDLGIKNVHKFTHPAYFYGYRSNKDLINSERQKYASLIQ